MTGPGPPVPRPGDAAAAAGADTVYFCSDYGQQDEFAGVVRAVLRRRAPHATVIDLSHEVPPFDVRAGAGLLARALPHLGPGVVLAVVDPGVGGPRRALVVEAAGRGPAGIAGPDGTGGGDGPRWFVGPDNGLLLAAVAAAGGVSRVVALGGTGADRPPGPATFDGRDVFAPAVAALCNGVDPAALGHPVDPAGLVRVPAAVVEEGALDDGRRLVRAEVTWVDRFGNVALAAAASHLPAEVPAVAVGTAAHPLDAGGPGPGPGGRGADEALVVRTFSDLDVGQPGLLVDAGGQLALVVREGSAALRFGIVVGELVQLVW